MARFFVGAFLFVMAVYVAQLVVTFGLSALLVGSYFASR